MAFLSSSAQLSSGLTTSPLELGKYFYRVDDLVDAAAVYAAH